MNPDVVLTLDDAVEEVLGALTGLDLSYDPTLDRYRTIVRQLNRALRINALEQEWSYYSSVEEIGPVAEGDIEFPIRASRRPRVINDDAVRLVDATGAERVFAYFLPRDALHKYRERDGLWVSYTKGTLRLSRPIQAHEAGYTLHLPVMREPVMFRLPPAPDSPADMTPEVPFDIREQAVDFDYPDIIVARAAYFYAQADPVMQPRVQTLEQQYKTLGYALIERDTRNTDSPFQNEFMLPISGMDGGPVQGHRHPHADERWR